MIIIPARLASTRFPKKIFADVAGMPMIIRTAKLAEQIDSVVVACDDEKTVQLCESFNIKAVLTDINHASGTDRINEAAQKLNLKDDDIVVNLQGDEPFLETDVLKSFVDFTKAQKSNFIMTSAYKSISAEEAKCPNLVKVVLNEHSNAIYFSRSVIPYDRDTIGCEYSGHLGLYGFNVKSLKHFCDLGQCLLENTEKLEQLRAIYANLPIAMLKVNTKSFGIDTPEDLQKALKIFA